MLARSFIQNKVMERVPTDTVVRLADRIRTRFMRLRRKLVPPQETMIDYLSAFYVTQGVHVAARLGLADLMKTGDHSAEDLARATETHPEALYRLMRMLAALDVFDELPGRRFRLTEVGACLCSDSPYSLRDMALKSGYDIHWKPWGELYHSIKTGEPAFDQVYGCDYFEYMNRDENREKAKVFNGAMTSLSRQNSQAILAAYDFSEIGTLVDVAGGQGYNLGSILAEYPAMEGILFDRPKVVETANTVLQELEVADRCRTVGGSFFESVPKGGDAYLLVNILHDWGDEPSERILRSVREAIGPGGRLLIAEHTVPDDEKYHYGKLLDVAMLVITPGGKERTRAQFEDLFGKTGFRLAKIHRGPAHFNVIEAVPV